MQLFGVFLSKYKVWLYSTQSNWRKPIAIIFARTWSMQEVCYIWFFAIWKLAFFTCQKQKSKITCRQQILRVKFKLGVERAFYSYDL